MILAATLVSLWSMVSRSAPPEVRHVGVGRDLPLLPPKSIKAPPPPAEFVTETHGFLRVVYHPSLYESVRRLVRDAEAVRAQLSTQLGQTVLESIEVRIGRTPEEVAVLSPEEAPPPSGVSAVAYPTLAVAVLSRRAADGDGLSLDEAFRHQLAHLALFDATAGRPLPRWLREGFAVHTSGELSMRRLQTLWTAQLQGTVLSLAQLESFPDDVFLARVAWAESADFIRFLTRGPDAPRFTTLIARLRSGDDVDRALAEAYGVEAPILERRWREDLGKRYLALPLVIGTAAGWALGAVALVWAWRRRKRRAQAILRRWEREEAMEDARAAALSKAADRADRERATKEPRLLVVERGLGHVVYIVERKSVPKVEHDGKTHTLH